MQMQLQEITAAVFHHGSLSKFRVGRPAWEHFYGVNTEELGERERERDKECQKNMPWNIYFDNIYTAFDVLFMIKENRKRK